MNEASSALLGSHCVSPARRRLNGQNTSYPYPTDTELWVFETHHISDPKSNIRLQPLMILSSTLHWLLSQSLFLALVTLRDDLGILNESQSVAKLGFSCIAIFFSLIVGAIALLASFIMGFRRYPPGIPVVGSCSAAIAARATGFLKTPRLLYFRYNGALP